MPLAFVGDAFSLTDLRLLQLARRPPLPRPAEEHVPANCRGHAGSGLVPDATAMIQSYVRAVNVATVLRLLRSDGWVLVTQRGSHRQFKHPNKPGRVTVAGRPSHDLATGTLKSIMKQAGLEGWLR